MKKIVVILLSLGALVILVLLGVGYKLSSDFKKELEVGINKQIQQINQKTTKDFPLRIEAKPFVCSGLMSYECVSTEVEVFHKQTLQKLATLKNLAFNLSDISTDKAKISLNIPDIYLDFMHQIIQDEKDAGAKFVGNKLYNTFKPTALQCYEAYKMSDKKTGEVSSQGECKLTTNALDYTFGVDLKMKSEKFVGKKIFEMLKEYYSDSNAGAIGDYDIAVDNISLELNSQKLKESIYPLVEVFYEENQNSKDPFGGSAYKQSKVPFDENAYKQSIENFKNIAGIFMASTGMLGGPYSDALEGFVDGISQMATDKASGVKLSFVPKHNAPYFRLDESLMQNIDKVGVQQLILAKMFNNYDLKNQIIPNAAK